MENFELDFGEIAAIITVLGAVAALLFNDSGGSTRPIIDIPANFGQSGSGSNDDVDAGAGQTVDESTPGATQDSDGEWQVPDNVEQGGGEGSLWAGEGTGFNPEQRTDLVNDPSTVDGEEQEHTWVGL
jgi:hypothetical protein